MEPNAIIVDQSAAASVVPKSLSDEPEVEASPKLGGGCIDLFIVMFILTCQARYRNQLWRRRARLVPPEQGACPIEVDIIERGSW